MKITVQRAFLIGGKRHDVGASLDVADSVARELIASNKATFPQEAPAAPPGPLTTESAAAVVKGKAAAKDKAP